MYQGVSSSSLFGKESNSAASIQLRRMPKLTRKQRACGAKEKLGSPTHGLLHIEMLGKSFASTHDKKKKKNDNIMMNANNMRGTFSDVNGNRKFYRFVSASSRPLRDLQVQNGCVLTCSTDTCHNTC